MTNSAVRAATATSMSSLLSVAVTLLAVSQSAFVDAMRIPPQAPSSSLFARDFPIKRSPRVIPCTGTMRIDENIIQCPAGLYPSADGRCEQSFADTSTMWRTLAHAGILFQSTGRRCIACQDPYAITCTSSEAVTCKSGIAPKDGYCLTSWDCNGAPPRYLAPDNVSCYPCPSQNATSCDRNGGSTGCSYGVPENGACVAVKCPTSSVITDGNGCCPDPYAITCNSGGSLSCKYGTPSDGRCPKPADCSGSPPRYPSKDSESGLSCLDCPTNSTSCDDQGQATACSYGDVSGGQCKEVMCPTGPVSVHGSSCCSNFTLTCEDTNNSLICDKGYKVSGTMNGTIACQGPYSSRYGRGTFMYGARPSPFNFWPRTSVETCAIEARRRNTTYMWTANTGRGQCLFIPIDGFAVDVKSWTNKRWYDFGIFGTCDETTRDWSVGSEHAGECEDLLLI
ncbi:BQ5605_C007g04439 [Microbotryum silenes-dioicae]|uniref:BQ5605_C007g04439 protein n=1 Tax=Microbotryum silenes-dioicae TaxID=796604 RepID=A0A2X0MU49_9BASI|nr:BQ5605_C007g04439 [Microbotryum silenes-dioicae]